MLAGETAGCLTSASDDEFWEDLLAFIEHGEVIPVIGEELLTVGSGSAKTPLYRAVAEELLSRYKVAGHSGLRQHHELNDAVCALASAGVSVAKLYRPINDILNNLVKEQSELPLALRQLAAIKHFDLFASTTPDDLLARAINAVRSPGVSSVDEIEYAPNLPLQRQHDMPAKPSSNYTAVFYLFGKSDVSPFFAIHDEDALEFPYRLQAAGAPERMFSQLRGRNLLMIGCNFADWLSRFFIRLSNSERLFSNQRLKREFLVDREIAADENLVSFLRNFSQQSRCSSLDAHEFVDQLYRRWSERNGDVFSPAADTPIDPKRGPETRQLAGAFFISYSGTDLGAAKNLFAGLSQIGADVAWFDKSELKPGDDWHNALRSAIQRCSLFLPLLSSGTESRNEGYFRLEWLDAAERSKRIQGRKFIIPIVVDPEFGGSSHYTLVPEQFKTAQYGHAPLGNMSETLRQELQEQLRKLRRARAV